jgi:hypothetical protein
MQKEEGGRELPGPGSWEGKGKCSDSTYLVQQQLLADDLCKAFTTGLQCSSICSSGYPYLRYYNMFA